MRERQSATEVGHGTRATRREPDISSNVFGVEDIPVGDEATASSFLRRLPRASSNRDGGRGGAIVVPGDIHGASGTHNVIQFPTRRFQEFELQRRRDGSRDG